MKVMTLNSSPRGDGQSKTGLMLESLVEGMREAGADVESISLRDKTIKPCAGCFTCWTRTPGTCIHQDDMSRDLFPRWLESDLVVYASPLYHYTINSVMKDLFERTLPMLEPFFLKKNGRTFHPLRHRGPKIVFLSVAGFPEISVFDQLTSWVNFVFGGDGIHEKVLVAEIYRPMSEGLTNPYFKDVARDILAATREAGRELVTSAAVSDKTMARLMQPMLEDPGIFVETGNLMWKTCIADGVTPKQLWKNGFVPRPDSTSSFLAIMQIAFKPDAAGQTNARLQFNFSGQQTGSCYLSIDNGQISGAIGTTDQANLTINAPFETWMDVITHKADGQQLFMEQKYTADGDLGLLMQMNQFFGNNKKSEVS